MKTATRAFEELTARGGRELLLTGGEPFPHPGLGQLVAAAEGLERTILTDAMLFDRGRHRETLEVMDRSVVLQVSRDPVTATLHDRRRGTGSSDRALAGIGQARAAGSRVRVADERFADTGLHVSPENLGLEPTITADGAWWHPVAVTDPTLKIYDAPQPLSEVPGMARDTLAVQDAAAATGRKVFRCA